eukprot:scaffold2691_cov417-Prasinococcus_capsulatus_cf.AAC.25
MTDLFTGVIGRAAIKQVCTAHKAYSLISEWTQNLSLFADGSAHEVRLAPLRTGSSRRFRNAACEIAVGTSLEFASLQLR